MGSVNVGEAAFTWIFRYQGLRCREHTLMDDSPENRLQLMRLLEQIDADMRLGCFV